MAYIPWGATNAHQYDDLLHMPHHVSDHHPHMSRTDRAAQFSPFAALTGYDAAITETGRLTDEKIQISDSRLSAIDERLQYLAAHISDKPEIEVTYFLQDNKKEGGSYKITVSTLKKLDTYEQLLILQNGLQIPFMDIFRLKGSCFASLGEDFY